MGCVSSALLNHDDDLAQITGSGLGHHIVSLTSTTYGLLTLDPPSDHSPTTPPPRFTLGSIFPSPLSEPRSTRPDPPEVINSWELMAGLDPTIDSFRFSPLPPPQPSKPFFISDDCLKEYANPNFRQPRNVARNDVVLRPFSVKRCLLDGFEVLCPPNGENRAVVYTTTLRGVRKTFEACNAVRAAIEGVGVSVCERDISMDRGFKEELRELMKGKESGELVPPRVFVEGRYVGGAEEVMRIVEEGYLGDLLQGLPRLRAGYVCEGCGGARFLPCFRCNGSCKMVVDQKEGGRSVVARCSECNENGLVLCPICS
ncbi:hypothetical protein RJ639_020412 [Escallonia herrerae]|uniref:Glutaredoxin domain-containing protein n=1 Tax=Escallonia herrerae TaxID=1293975 RepID=A0AA88V4P5_9ASTE|nr:hypothetical protein RJ639_020412 [Escallonia herrerae]